MAEFVLNTLEKRDPGEVLVEHSAATPATVSGETFPGGHYDAIKFNRNSLSL